MARYKVNAPNGQNVVINIGGYMDLSLRHGQIVEDEKIVEKFPNLFVKMEDEEDTMPRPQMLQEVPAKEQNIQEDRKETTTPSGTQKLNEVPENESVKPDKKETTTEDDDYSSLMENNTLEQTILNEDDEETTTNESPNTSKKKTTSKTSSKTSGSKSKSTKSK